MLLVAINKPPVARTQLSVSGRLNFLGKISAKRTLFFKFVLLLCREKTIRNSRLVNLTYLCTVFGKNWISLYFPVTNTLCLQSIARSSLMDYGGLRYRQEAGRQATCFRLITGRCKGVSTFYPAGNQNCWGWSTETIVITAAETRLESRGLSF